MPLWKVSDEFNELLDPLDVNSGIYSLRTSSFIPRGGRNKAGRPDLSVSFELATGSGIVHIFFINTPNPLAVELIHITIGRKILTSE